MGELRDPSRALAKRILTEVGFENRLTGFSLRERAGAQPVWMYSFKEVVSLLNVPRPCLDFKELELWIREVMDDQELSAQIAAVVKNSQSDQDRIRLIKHFMELRLNQCNERVY